MSKEMFDNYISERFIRKFNKKLRDKIRKGIILDSLKYGLDSEFRICDLVLIKSFKLTVYARTYKCELRYSFEKNKIQVFIIFDYSDYLIPLDFEANISKLGKGNFTNDFQEWLNNFEEITKKFIQKSLTDSEKIITPSRNIIEENFNKIEQINKCAITL